VESYKKSKAALICCSGEGENSPAPAPWMPQESDAGRRKRRRSHLARLKRRTTASKAATTRPAVAAATWLIVRPVATSMEHHLFGLVMGP